MGDVGGSRSCGVKISGTARANEDYTDVVNV